MKSQINIFAKRAADRIWSKHLNDWFGGCAKKIPLIKINLALIGKGEMAELNQRYRKHPGPTTVLSFIWQTQPFIYAEIYLCLAEIKNRCPQDKNIKDEMKFIFIHALAHSLGYDHVDNRAEKAMNKRCEELLSLIK